MKKIPEALSERFSQMSFLETFELVSHHQSAFDKKTKDVLVDLKWLYQQDSFEASFTVDESDNFYYYPKEGSVPKRLENYSYYFESFKRYRINLDNIGDFMLHVLEEQNINLKKLNETISSLEEEKALKNNNENLKKPKIL